MSSQATFAPLPIERPRNASLKVLVPYRDTVVAGVVETGDTPESPGVQRLLVAPAAGGEWRETHRVPLAPTHVRQGDRLLRLTLAQGAATATVTRVPGGGAGSLLIPVVSAVGSRILRSSDGETFDELPNPSPAQGLGPVGQVVAAGGRMFGLAASTREKPFAAAARAEDGMVFVRDDPAEGVWVSAGAPGDGDGAARRVHGIAGFAGSVWAAVTHPEAGFELWRAEPDGAPPFTWRPVLREGTWRFTVNKVATAMVIHADALWLGTAAPIDEPWEIGHNGPEILRVEADGAWEVVVGAPRFTPDGLKVPLAEWGPGFGDRRNAAITLLSGGDGGMLACHQFLDRPGGGPTHSGPASFWAERDGEWSRIGGVDGVGPVTAACLAGGRLLVGLAAGAPGGPLAVF